MTRPDATRRRVAPDRVTESATRHQRPYPQHTGSKSASASRRTGWLAPTASPPPFAINPAGPIDWGDLAYYAGDFDQAHLGHEFPGVHRARAGRYVEVGRQFLREHPGHVLDSWPLPAN